MKPLYLQTLHHMVWAVFFYSSNQSMEASSICIICPYLRRTEIYTNRVAVTWSCERFNDYLLGTTFHINTDHKPLVPSTKNLDELPTRIQRFKMRLMRYSFTISHVAGKNLITVQSTSINLQYTR